MKIVRVHVQNFKGIKSREIDFRGSEGSPRNLTAILGDNGSGKTTVLQAIALVLALATRKISTPVDFAWPGFLPERVGSMGPTRVSLEMLLGEREIALTQGLYREWFDSLDREGRVTVPRAQPESHKLVTLEYREGLLTSPQGPGGISEFRGRFFLGQILRRRRLEVPPWLELGGVFWFDQYRNLGSIGDVNDSEGVRARWYLGAEKLRSILLSWWRSEESLGGINSRLGDLEKLVSSVFPGTKLKGIEVGQPATGTEETLEYVLFQQGEKVYDLAEMSSGEQAVFPILYEFSRSIIGKSVVLIDELELHLHPPEQQAVLALLPRLGSDCQYVVTTHSAYLSDVIPDEYEVRLSGGRLSL